MCRSDGLTPKAEEMVGNRLAMSTCVDPSHCTLPFGHEGWHRDARTEARWGERRESDRDALEDCGPGDTPEQGEREESSTCECGKQVLHPMAEPILVGDRLHARHVCRKVQTRDRSYVGTYVCDQNLHVSGGDCPHCVPYEPPPPAGHVPGGCSDSRHGRAVEVLRGLVEAHSSLFGLVGHNPLWDEARALVEEVDR